MPVSVLTQRTAAEVSQRVSVNGKAVMKPERVEDYLNHIAEAIERKTHYLQPVTWPPL